ncbi:glycosyl transferase [Pedobacter yulinensis]|uniref:Glycosyl transferase n=1 Tax=Pedobacter yulinensis TaxID=2126353 RepID=A0A2T3HP01_9SPHI|nr:glycosyltransferase [Pedobacter yulinensis]PST84111.1 glycosyl transferase [Pedobacter yulinensis]
MEVPGVISFISAFFTVLYIVLVLAFIRGWHKLKIFSADAAPGSTSVSVIVAARNEEQNIADTIEDLLMQDYDGRAEVIIIDDHSTDQTAAIVSSYAEQGVKLISLNENQALNSYKKKAIQTAIARSESRLIITTDADCRMGPHWLRTIVQFYERSGCKMISSPVAYHQERNWFETAQSLEFLYLIGLGASTIGNNKPSTCNGANLAYERDAFHEVGGFKGIDDLASGDDELLLHKMAVRYPGKIGFLKNPDAVVYTTAKETLGQFIQQRRRWASKSTRYKDKSIIALGVCIWLFNLSILVNAAAGLFYPVLLQTALCQLVAKMIIEACFLWDVTGFMKRRKLLAVLPLLNVLHILYMVYIGIAGNSGKYNWKGRMVK